MNMNSHSVKPQMNNFNNLNNANIPTNELNVLDLSDELLAPDLNPEVGLEDQNMNNNISFLVKKVSLMNNKFKMLFENNDLNSSTNRIKTHRTVESDPTSTSDLTQNEILHEESFQKLEICNLQNDFEYLSTYLHNVKGQ
eukprot:CAMPEP_0116916220 /NCGR_PEP_ID=MMETSP0467-20121206/18396_1 /TAXON_ID=283647 /ORGANISM="Mesodinium pulex, Strain SPMC105" /LENGTH=139 /DNA_ID=CAMNT_0004593037 /DNA_START=198 /DNA_END=617 /DNA_ORIENTATION=-